RWAPAVARMAYRSEYRLEDLLVFADRDFVEQCYRVVLRRPPDPAGFTHYLDRLRRGELSKVEVIGEIRFSPEGRQRGVHVDGLLVPYTLQRWGRQRLLGRLLRWAQGVFRLGAFQHRLNLHDAAQGRDVQETGQLINQIAGSIEDAWRARDAETARREQAWSESLAGMPKRADLDLLESRIGELDACLRNQQHAADEREQRHREAIDGLAARLGVAVAAVGETQSTRERRGSQAVDGLATRDALEAVANAARRAEARAAAAEARADALASELAAARAQYAAFGVEWRKELAAGIAGPRLAIETQERQLAELRADAAAQRAQLEGMVGAVREEIGQRIEPLAQHRDEVRQSLEGAASRMEALGSALAAVESALGQRMSDWDAVMRHDVGHQHQGLVVVVEGLKEELEQLRRQHSTASVFERRMLEDAERLGQRLEALDARVRPVEAAIVSGREEDAARAESFDALYAAFEDRFRGSRELIHSRIAPYLDWVREAGAGTREAPVLDVGCGRGEWLEMLRDAEMHGRGVDLNRLFVDACTGRGLDVQHADALQALRAMPESSIGALTSMHLVEHLPFEMVVALLDEARRVLRPGGLILLETPNPENVDVGACWFYMDPTHRNPIPPEALRWIVESRGFHAVRIERLTVGRELNWPGPVDPALPGAATINAMSQRFSAAPDYAVLGRRP
ncbi:MAG: methyltransferase domain-containing protein, partial [Silanimonas sp.]